VAGSVKYGANPSIPFQQNFLVTAQVGMQRNLETF
jgi:hypothetical protein